MISENRPKEHKSNICTFLEEQHVHEDKQLVKLEK